MHLAIVGTGAVGTALGTRLSERHRLTFGSRDPESEAARQLDEALGRKADVRLTPDAVAEAEVVILATPWPVTRQVVEGLDLAGKVLVDVTNDVGADFQPDDPSPRSCAEKIASYVPEARVVKAFNSVGAGVLLDPVFDEMRPAMPVCGDDAEAKRLVMGLVEDVGFAPVDAGPLGAARQLEALALLWMRLAYGQGLGPNHAFAVLTR